MAVALPIVEFAGVSKTFDGTTVIDNLDLTIEAGQLFGMIGPSGCGKTTIIRLLMGVLKPTAGAVRVMNTEPAHLTSAQRGRIGYTPQGFFLYPTLTVAENIRFVAGLFGMGYRHRRRRAAEVLRFLEIWDARRRLARDLSGGMQRRLELACALVHEPTLLVVDEPTAGLDPLLREKIWDYLCELRDQGTTIIVTTQYIDETQHCDRVAFISRGALLAVGAPAALRQRAMGGDLVDLQVETIGREEINALRRLPNVRFMQWTNDDILRLVVDEATTATPIILQELQRRGVEVTAVRPYEPTFEEVFTRIVTAPAGRQSPVASRQSPVP